MTDEQNQTPETEADTQPAESQERDYEELYLRALADQQNLRRQMERMRLELPQSGMEHCLNAILPLLDNLERARQGAPEEHTPWIDGVLAILDMGERSLAEAGVVRIGTLGEPVDPHVHEVVTVDMESPEGEISQILESGYKLANGKLIRPAKVIVGGKSA